MASWRHLSRVIVMQSFFENLMRSKGLEEILEYNLNEYGEKIEDTEFAENLAEKMKKYQNKIEKLIKKHAPEWPIEKMNPEIQYGINNETMVRILAYNLYFDKLIGKEFDPQDILKRGVAVVNFG